MEKKKFYLCTVCGNLFGVINDSGVNPVCCAKDMRELIPNTSDGAGEKHVPVILRDKNAVIVKVGSAAHPMLPAHYIQWITIIHGDKTQRAVLNPGEAPEASFTLDSEEGPVTAYEYCNIHGLWTAEV